MFTLAMVAWLTDVQEEKPERRILRICSLAAGLDAYARAPSKLLSPPPIPELLRCNGAVSATMSLQQSRSELWEHDWCPAVAAWDCGSITWVDRALQLITIDGACTCISVHKYSPMTIALAELLL